MPIGLKSKLARELVEAYPDLPKKTLAKMLFAKHSATFKSMEHARSTVRYVTGATGNRSREKVGKNVIDKPHGKAGTIYQMPESKGKPWVPHKITGNCILVLSDLHVPYHDPQAIETAISFSRKEHNLDAVLINGDGADCHSWSKWERAPTETDCRGELNAMRQFLLWLTYELELPITYKQGNHEEWLDKFWWRKAPEMFGMPHTSFHGLLSIDDDLEPVKEIKEITWVGEKRPIIAGKLPIFHGHELPRGLTNAVNPSRGAFLRMTDTVIIGHHHRSSSHTEYTWDKKPIGCWSTGCLCMMHPDYAPINKWNHGFAVLEIDSKGGFSVYNYKMMKDYSVVTA